MWKFIKENKWLVLGVLAVVIGLPVVILTPSRLGFIPRDIGVAIVGYCGSIIGGFLTLYGVWWTIDDNKKARSKEQGTGVAVLSGSECEFCSKE